VGNNAEGVALPTVRQLPEEGIAVIRWQECNRQTRMALNWMQACALFEGTTVYEWIDRKGHL